MSVPSASVEQSVSKPSYHIGKVSLSTGSAAVSRKERHRYAFDSTPPKEHFCLDVKPGSPEKVAALKGQFIKDWDNTKHVYLSKFRFLEGPDRPTIGKSFASIMFGGETVEPRFAIAAAWHAQKDEWKSKPTMYDTYFYAPTLESDGRTYVFSDVYTYQCEPENNTAISFVNSAGEVQIWKADEGNLQYERAARRHPASQCHVTPTAVDVYTAVDPKASNQDSQASTSLTFQGDNGSQETLATMVEEQSDSDTTDGLPYSKKGKGWNESQESVATVTGTGTGTDANDTDDAGESASTATVSRGSGRAWHLNFLSRSDKESKRQGHAR
ncbi:hypothetical protein I316_03541 [Kwoniella heveanensis BCC8398]|uniref:Uncharacterized protein n=1 Tax=Kwoniella heveanensis BCC8398 TaxID=1296120 RepID=A0A1B9GVD8_9TREE|nr:hypothetical protein I316_03541 [Kwoniella heveanensis BCC8398]